ncbi:MAG: cyclic nucleotide-binding domain-containing protein, partial [Fibrobacter sp.]|nr:cyclic nucleotide-binding domain-containing protein [Fibrobacter sp.]
MEKYLHLLAGLPLFENIDPRDIPSMLNCLHAQKGTFSKDSFIRNEGDPADFIGIVLEGTIQVLQYDFGGNRRIISSFSAGDMFAEAISCAEVPALPFSIQAASDCVILFLNEKQILHPC